MNYKKEAQNITEAIGGKDNIEAIAHCATRLRLVLKDESQVNEDRLNDMDVVKGTFSTGGQYQIIIGSGTVNKVFSEMESLTGLEASTTSEVKEKSTKKLNPIQQFVKMLSDIFVPIIPAIVAGGLLMGINNILTAKDLFYIHMLLSSNLLVFNFFTPYPVSYGLRYGRVMLVCILF